MTFEIRKLASDDSDLAKELFTLFQIDDGIKNPTVASNDYLKNLLSKNDFHVVVAFEKGKIIGGLTAYELSKYKGETTEMFLYEIVVEENSRRTRVATKLVEFLNRICIEKNISEMFVITEVDNESAKKLYQSMGGKLEETALFNYQIKQKNE